MSRQCSRLSYLQVIPLASRLPLPRRFHLEDHRSSLRSNPSCSLPVSQAVNHPCNQTDNQLLNLLVSHEDNHPATNTETCSSTNILTCRYSSNAAHHSTKSAPFFVTNISTVSPASLSINYPAVTMPILTTVEATHSTTSPCNLAMHRHHSLDLDRRLSRRCYFARCPKQPTNLPAEISTNQSPQLIAIRSTQYRPIRET